MSTKLTYELLRSRGFRLTTTQASHTPHMVRTYGRYDCAIELTEPIDGWNSRDHGWFCWLRSDLAGRYSRFVHLRHIETIEQLERLWFAITDTPLDEQPWDETQFAEALAHEREDAQRRYIEYAKHNLRYGYVPG